MEQENREHIHILIVDDDENIREIVRKTMNNNGYRCSIAGNAREALKILEKKNIDVVITDFMMPDINGIELLKLIKEKHDADVIMITGFSEDLTYEEVIEQGARDFIKKPVASRELLVRLKRVIKERTVLAERNRVKEELAQSLVKLRRILEETVDALASALEKRDPYTAGHQKRVALLACAIAEEMGLSVEHIEGIRIAGLLHDIGKISVPTDILNKPSKLSTNEFNLIMEHPTVGYDILKDIEFDQPITQIILQHHERINGTGYPYNLRGDDIILQAQVLAVADVVEAMASHRPYRPALGIEKSLSEIMQNKGVLYVSDISTTCLKLFNEKGFVFD